jgi:hypothetical protein
MDSRLQYVHLGARKPAKPLDFTSQLRLTDIARGICHEHRTGSVMRLIALIVLAAALGGSASAQTPECRAIADPAKRLACYDKAAPPIAADESPKLHPNPYRSKVDPGKYMDSLGNEDAQVTARMNGICRGC